MATVILISFLKAKNQLDSYLNDDRISPFLDFAEQKLRLKRSLIAVGMLFLFFFIFCSIIHLGLFGILAIYLVIGWGNDFVCNFIGILYPIYAS